MSLKLVTQSVWDNPGNRGKRIRKSLAAVGWQLQKRLLGTPRLLTLPNGVRFKAYPDCVVSSALIYSDWPEYHELMFARSILRPGDVVLDVGANVGHIALLLADVVGPENVFAFEPAPAAYERLGENWQLNDWPADRLFQVALGADAGSVYLEDAGCPKTTVAVSEERGGGQTVEVPLAPLDGYRDRWQDRPVGVLKIDVEGYEKEVFRGSDALLRRDRPRLIMFESLEGTLDAEIRQFLEARSYVIFQLDEEGRPDPERASNQNLFATPEELEDRIVEKQMRVQRSKK
jgi:FkbM family methyltransferase